MRHYSTHQTERGFTLIELLTSIVIIGVLAGLSIQVFKDAKGRAAYGVAVQTLLDGRKAVEAAFTEPDASYASVTYTQATSGALTDSNARAIMPGFVLSPNVRLNVAYDNSCVDSSCIIETLEVRHCRGEQYTNWTRFGDGQEILLERIDGSGC